MYKMVMTKSVLCCVWHVLCVYGIWYMCDVCVLCVCVCRWVVIHVEVRRQLLWEMDLSFYYACPGMKLR